MVEHDGDILTAVKEAMITLPIVFPEATKMNELLTILQKAIDLSGTDLDDLDAIRQLGQGWVGEEALAIAIYCALKHPTSFEDAIVAAVNHSGDSDSSAASSAAGAAVHSGNPERR